MIVITLGRPVIDGSIEVFSQDPLLGSKKQKGTTLNAVGEFRIEADGSQRAEK